MNEPPPFPAPATAKNSTLAIWSLVLGILSVTCFSIFTGIPAIICGHMAWSRIKHSAGALQGGGLAIGGLVTGYVSLALAIFLIPMLSAIAIPNFVKAREAAMKNACVNNLRQIEAAKGQWALELKKSTGDSIDEGQVNKLIGHPLMCPAGGTYSYGAVGTLPRCSKAGHQLSPD